MESHENTHIFKIKKQNSSNIFNIHIFTTFYNLKYASNILLSSKYINPPPQLNFIMLGYQQTLLKIAGIRLTHVMMCLGFK